MTYRSWRIPILLCFHRQIYWQFLHLGFDVWCWCSTLGHTEIQWQIIVCVHWLLLYINGIQFHGGLGATFWQEGAGASVSKWRVGSGGVHGVSSLAVIRQTLPERLLSILQQWWLIDMDELLDLVLRDLRVLFLEVSHAVSLGGESDVTAHAQEGLLGAAAVGAQVVLQGAEELEVLSAVLTHGVRGLEIFGCAGGFSHVLIVPYSRIYLFLHIFAMLFPFNKVNFHCNLIFSVKLCNLICRDLYSLNEPNFN